MSAADGVSPEFVPGLRFYLQTEFNSLVTHLEIGKQERHDKYEQGNGRAKRRSLCALLKHFVLQFSLLNQHLATNEEWYYYQERLL